MYDLIVFIGRFQPFHHGHRAVIRHALTQAKYVLILIGSANIGRDTRNPFTVEERCRVLSESCLVDEHIDYDRILFEYANDHPYDNNRWIAQIQGIVKGCAAGVGLTVDYTVAVTGHDRDESVLYRKFFPQWPFFAPPKPHIPVSGTGFRKAYFESQWDFSDLPGPSRKFLGEFASTPEFEELQAEWRFEQEYHKNWGPGPFLTCDNVVVKSGHVLVVERKKLPGKGRLALPGGHLEVGETLFDCATRELWEETQIFGLWEGNESLPQRLAHSRTVISPHFIASRVFDAPNRSRRARVITVAHIFKLPDIDAFPKVLGADDAARAFWMPLADIKVADFFEDHGFIVDKMLGYL